jgi:thiol-disulfide isomerase/thioredoxin
MKNIRAAAAVLSYLAIVCLAGYNLRGPLFGKSMPSTQTNSTPAATAQPAPEPSSTPVTQSDSKLQPETPPPPTVQAETSPKEQASLPANPPPSPTRKKDTRSQQSSIPVAGNGAVEVGERLPDFLLLGLNGNTLNESALRGHKTLFIIVSPTCPHCQRELKLLHQIENDYPAIEPVFASVFTIDQTRPLADMTGEGDHLYTGARDLATSLGLKGVPFLMLIDEKGVIRAIKTGELEESAFRDLLGKFSHGQPVAQLPKIMPSDAALTVINFFGEQA